LPTQAVAPRATGWGQEASPSGWGGTTAGTPGAAAGGAAAGGWGTSPAGGGGGTAWGGGSGSGTSPSAGDGVATQQLVVRGVQEAVVVGGREADLLETPLAGVARIRRHRAVGTCDGHYLLLSLM
jgi:hypothetical protein